MFTYLEIFARTRRAILTLTHLGPACTRLFLYRDISSAQTQFAAVASVLGKPDGSRPNMVGS